MSKTAADPKVVASVVPVREIPKKSKRHRWVVIGKHEWACKDCAQVKRSAGMMNQAYYDRDGKHVGHLAPPCDAVQG